MNKFLLVLSLAVVGAAANAQSISYTGGAYLQDFDSLLSTGTNNTWVDGVTLAGWYMRKMNDPDLPVGDSYNANTGSSNAGQVHSFGSAGSSERALGSIASTSVEHAAYGARFTNNTGQTMTSFTLTYDGEQWRDGLPVPAAAHKLMFSYNIGGSTIGADGQPTFGSGGYVADASFIRETALDFSGPILGTTAGALDGNAGPNRVAGITFTVSSLNWANGQDLWVRWVDLNDASNDHGLAIDNLRFSATAVPEPATMAALGLGVAALLRRRKK